LLKGFVTDQVVIRVRYISIAIFSNVAILQRILCYTS